MPNQETKYFSASFQTRNPSLRSYFGNVVKGQPKVYTTPFAKGETTSDMLKAWDATLVKINDKWPSLYEYETDMRSKVGPMSIMKPLVDRMDDIKSYYSDILLPGSGIDREALSLVMNEFQKLRGIRKRNPSNTLTNMKLSTNSGSPYFTKRRNVAELESSNLVVAFEGDEVTQHFDHEYWKAAAVLGWRGQEGGADDADVKQRVVWMFPLAVNIEELGVYQQIIELSQRFEIVRPWVSNDSVDVGVTRLFDSKGKSDLIVCTDFTKFDQHFNRYLQEAAYTIISSMLTPSGDTPYWLNCVFPIKYMIPMAYDYGKVMFGEHGMGSGSGGTNVDETLAHRALQYEAAIRNKSILNPNSMCLGDDGILSYPGISIDDVVQAYTSHGLEMNDDKQYASINDCIFLRRWHHEGYREKGICVGVYSTMRALGRLRYLERFYDPDVWGPESVALRQLSIIENCKWHPLKEEFVEFCMKRDKYRLGIDIPGFLANIVKRAKEITSDIPDLMGYTHTLQNGGKVTGIDKWWIVQYLKSRA